jgi:1,2-diacylglycerol 3-alpha-glucosyltransferase
LTRREPLAGGVAEAPDPMRVLITTESFLPYLSGVTVSVDALARGLGARGHDVLVLAPRPAGAAAPAPVGSPGPAPGYAWLPSFQPLAIAPPGYRVPWPIPWATALRTARAFRPDVVHAQSPFVTGLFARGLARSLGVPLVFTHHTRFADYGHYLGPLAAPGSWAVDGYLRRFWRSCAAIVAPSTDLADEIRDRLPAPKRSSVRVIPTGVDVDGFRRTVPLDPRASAGWPADAVVVASLGRLAPEKRPDLVLDGFAEAARRDPRLRLLVIGGGPSEPSLRDRASAAENVGRVHLTGSLPRPEALARLAGADLFLFVSRTETQGLVLAEALAAGLPAVAVRAPGVADSVRDGIDGTIVDEDPAATLPGRLGEAVVALAHPATLAATRARVGADSGRFAVDRRVAETEGLYADLARRERHR